MSPDPYSGSYDFTNPQSLNRYSYVLNNPYGFTDPNGLFRIEQNCYTQNAYVDGSYDSSNTYCDYTYISDAGDLGSAGFLSGPPDNPADASFFRTATRSFPSSLAPSNPMPSKLHSCISKTWASTNKAGLALDVAGAGVTLAAPEAAPLVGVVSALIGSASAFQSVDQGVSVSNYGAAAVSLGGASVSAIAPSAHFFAGASRFTASLKSVGRGFAGASLALDAVNFANGVSTCLSH